MNDPSGLSGREVSHFRVLEPLGADHALGFLGYIAGRQGRRAEASRLADSLRSLWENQRHTPNASSPAMSIASVYAGLGQRDSALTWLERATESHAYMLYVLVDPTFRDLRSEPRFRAVLAKMGYPTG